MIFILILLVLSSTTRTFEITNTDFQDTDDYILCRSCGSNVSASSKLVSVSSPESRYAFNDTLFKKEQVLIQVLSFGLFFDYPVITVTQSDCVSDGEWEEHDTWFPGYKWKICTCPECGNIIGWVFEPVEHKSKKPFYGLILSNLIAESCKK